MGWRQPQQETSEYTGHRYVGKKIFPGPETRFLTRQQSVKRGMLVKKNWLKSRVIFLAENEHLVCFALNLNKEVLNLKLLCCFLQFKKLTKLSTVIFDSSINISVFSGSSRRGLFWRLKIAL